MEQLLGLKFIQGYGISHVYVSLVYIRLNLFVNKMFHLVYLHNKMWHTPNKLLSTFFFNKAKCYNKLKLIRYIVRININISREIH